MAVEATKKSRGGPAEGGLSREPFFGTGQTHGSILDLDSLSATLTMLPTPEISLNLPTFQDGDFLSGQLQPSPRQEKTPFPPGSVKASWTWR